jgi:hypothetical protein
MRAMLGIAVRAAVRVNPTRTAAAQARCFGDKAPVGATRAAHQLELELLAQDLKAAQALALEEMKTAHALALEDMKAAQALALQKLELDQTRGISEVLFGIKHDTAQKLKLGAVGIVLVASGSYLIGSMLHSVTASLRTAEAKAEDARKDVRALMTKMQSACCSRGPKAMQLCAARLWADANARAHSRFAPAPVVRRAPPQGVVAAPPTVNGGAH